jgi:hypothetical protein
MIKQRTIRIDRIKEGGDVAETNSTRKRRNQLNNKIRFKLSPVTNAAYKRHQLLHGLPARTRCNNVHENTQKKAIPVLQNWCYQI